MQKDKYREWMPYFFLTGIMFIYHLFIHTHKMDDLAIYGDLLDYSPLLPWLKYRYETWTSRVLIDGLIVLFVEYNPWIWKLLNIGCWLLLAHSLIVLTGCRREWQIKYITVFLIFIYPIFTMGSAGWCATHLNYLWPMAFGCYALTIITVPKDRPLRWYRLLSYLCAAIFACSQEQMCVIFLTVMAAHLTLSVIFKTKPGHLYLKAAQFGIAAIQLFLILTCEGNQARKLVEVDRWMPDYPLLSFRDKLYIGFTDTMEIVVFPEDNAIFIIFSLILFTLVFLKTKNIVIRLFSLLLPFATLIGTFLLHGRDRGIPLYLLVIFSLIFSLGILSNNMRDFLGYGAVLGSGFISRVAVGYSPSIYVSGNRTCLFLYGTILFCMVKLLYDNRNLHPKLIPSAYWSLRIFSYICIAMNLAKFMTRYLESLG